jgi:hypothetical protein
MFVVVVSRLSSSRKLWRVVQLALMTSRRVLRRFSMDRSTMLYGAYLERAERFSCLVTMGATTVTDTKYRGEPRHGAAFLCIR